MITSSSASVFEGAGGSPSSFELVASFEIVAAAETLKGASGVGAFAVDGEAAAGDGTPSACLPTTSLTGPAAASSPLAAFSCFA